jgi:hypothetical protein
MIIWWHSDPEVNPGHSRPIHRPFVWNKAGQISYVLAEMIFWPMGQACNIRAVSRTGGVEKEKELGSGHIHEKKDGAEWRARVKKKVEAEVAQSA